MNLDLTGKNAIVCGSTQGIGRACAQELARLGARITLIARNKEALEQIADELHDVVEAPHDYVCADFSEPQVLQQALSDYFSEHQPLFHILVNNTGGPPPGPITDATIPAFFEALNRHLACNHLLAQAVLPGMKKAKFGRIINIISTSVKQPIKGLGVSNTTRGAVASWAKTLAGEVGQFGVTVNNVLPGTTQTGRLDALIQTKAQMAGVSTQQIVREMEAEVPASRIGKPEEVAAAVAFLASPAAAYINGINLPVDGGRTLCL